MRIGTRTALTAWFVTAVFYFYQYALRSAPGVMMPQLSEAFGLSAASVAGLAALFYYSYSPSSLIAGVALDRLGPRTIVPISAVAIGIGALLFASGNTYAAGAGRLMQGAGGVFAFLGATFIATTYFPPAHAATLIGATQMFGMAGGSAGQFLVGPAIGAGIRWSTFWTAMGVGGLAIGVILFAILPKSPPRERRPDWLASAFGDLRTVFRNPQSILCGVIAGLLFIPTTIFDMIWGVRYLQEAHGIDYASAVLRSSMVPVGWMIGCPLIGFLSDRIGRRKPVIVGGSCALLVALAWILFGSTEILPRYVLGLAAGIASGSAMVPYTVVKEANPANLSGTATGVLNFVSFTLSALLAPVFGWRLTQLSAGSTPAQLAHYQATFMPLLVGVGLAVVLTLFLKETGSAIRDVHPFSPTEGPHGRSVWHWKVRSPAR